MAAGFGPIPRWHQLSFLSLSLSLSFSRSLSLSLSPHHHFFAASCFSSAFLVILLFCILLILLLFRDTRLGRKWGRRTRLESKWGRGTRLGRRTQRGFFPQQNFECLLNFCRRVCRSSGWICLFPSPPCNIAKRLLFIFCWDLFPRKYIISNELKLNFH